MAAISDQFPWVRSSAVLIHSGRSRSDDRAGLSQTPLLFLRSTGAAQFPVPTKVQPAAASTVASSDLSSGRFVICRWSEPYGPRDARDRLRARRRTEADARAHLATVGWRTVGCLYAK